MKLNIKNKAIVFCLMTGLALPGCANATSTVTETTASIAAVEDTTVAATSEETTSEETVATTTAEETTTATVAEETTVETTEEVTSDTEEKFTYEHDPRENAEAMKDIVENPDAVYGFSPDPDSTRLGEYAAYDWTDEEVVAQAKEARMEYEASLDSMTDILYEMRDDGCSIEEIARAVSAERNRLRLAAYADDPEGLETVKKSNLDTYGNEDGPTADSLYEKYGSWELVLQKAFSPNMGMDACCGLYDDNYQLYLELGLVEE